MESNDLTYAIIGAAIEVHRRLGSGLWESVPKMFSTWSVGIGRTCWSMAASCLN